MNVNQFAGYCYANCIISSIEIESYLKFHRSKLPNSTVKLLERILENMNNVETEYRKIDWS